jgi:glycosyltransferase involved in cell wall biosynthesis
MAPSMARVAILRPYAALPSEGGSNDRYVNLCEKLIALGAAPELYCSDFVHNAKQRRSDEALALNAGRLPYLRQIRSVAYRRNVSPARIAHEALFGVKALWGLTRGARPDVVLVGEPLFGVGWMALLYGLFFRVPVIADLIDLWPEADTAQRGGLGAALRSLVYGALIASRGLRLRCYAATSFVARTYAQRLARPDAEAPVFYWGSQLTPNGPAETSAQQAVAIYAGSLGVGYDIATMLEAAAIVHRKGARLRIVIAGDGPKREDVLRAQAQGTVEYLGQLDREQLIAAYQKADIGLLAYQAGSQVAMPIKFYDCLNFGLVVVSSLTMEAQEIIAEKKIGVSYTPGDAKDLAAKLIEVSRDRIALDRTRAAGANLAAAFAVEGQYEGFARFVLNHARKA